MAEFEFVLDFIQKINTLTKYRILEKYCKHLNCIITDDDKHAEVIRIKDWIKMNAEFIKKNDLGEPLTWKKEKIHIQEVIKRFDQDSLANFWGFFKTLADFLFSKGLPEDPVQKRLNEIMQNPDIKNIIGGDEIFTIILKRIIKCEIESGKNIDELGTLDIHDLFNDGMIQKIITELINMISTKQVTIEKFKQSVARLIPLIPEDINSGDVSLKNILQDVTQGKIPEHFVNSLLNQK